MSDEIDTKKIAELSQQVDLTIKNLETFRNGLKDTVDQIEKGYRSTMFMYKASFYLGVGLIISAVLLAVFKSESLFPIIFAGAGTVDVVTVFISKPPKDLEASRADLAQLQAALYNWFKDSLNWDTYLLSIRKTRMEFDDVDKVSKKLFENTSKTIDFIEKYSRFHLAPTDLAATDLAPTDPKAQIKP